MSSNEFSGFSEKTLSFFRRLVKNNDKKWFTAHKAEYETEVLAPAQAFVMAMGQKLKTIAPGVVADPKINRSLFRIYRDARFSHDKSPYKTHLGIFLWEGSRLRMENSGFYFHIEPPEIWVGVGLYQFPNEMLPLYRQDVVHPVHGQALADAEKILIKRGYEINGATYKRVPRGFDPEHPNAKFLLHTGLYTGIEEKVPPEFFTPKFVDYCFKYCKAVLPLHQWLTAFVERLGT
jgi:uncharacterized protein (TIGR02453 family)